VQHPVAHEKMDGLASSAFFTLLVDENAQRRVATVAQRRVLASIPAAQTQQPTGSLQMFLRRADAAGIDKKYMQSSRQLKP